MYEELEALDGVSNGWCNHSLYTNWRAHVPEVLLKVGDAPRALRYMHEHCRAFREKAPPAEGGRASLIPPSPPVCFARMRGGSLFH